MKTSHLIARVAVVLAQVVILLAAAQLHAQRIEGSFNRG
jgi:hypothetical protein